MTRTNKLLYVCTGLIFLISIWRATSSPQIANLPLRTPERTGAISRPNVLDAPELARSLFSPVTSGGDAGGTLADLNKSNTQIPRLVGVVVEDGRGVAVIKQDNKMYRLLVTERIGDWIVSKIDARSAVLRKQNETRLLTLERNAVQRE